MPVSQAQADLLRIVGGGFIGSILGFLSATVLDYRRRTSEQKQALGAAALLVLEWSKLAALYPDKTEAELGREHWQLLTKIAEQVLKADRRRFRSLAAEVSAFVIWDDRRKSEQALQLFGKLIRAANPKLAEQYEHDFPELKARAVETALR